MNVTNFEFKAKVDQLESFEQKLLTLNPRFEGLDHQVDTYFNTKEGRLKLREGNIENSLIHYQRSNSAKAKESKVILYRNVQDKALKQILELHLGVKVVVDKQRKIYFIDHIKFHFDEVKGLGTFLEVEAIDTDGSKDPKDLESQCQHYFRFFQLTKDQLITHSYSDLLLNSNKR